MQESTGAPRMHYIDALRGYAIVGVLMTHCGMQVSPDSVLLRTIASASRNGVQLFFVASALALCFSVKSRSKNEHKWVAEFYIRRFFRIAPAFWLAAICYRLIDGFGPQYWAPNGIDAWQLILTFAFLHGWHPESINAVVPGGWSIAAEFSFYLIFPIIFSKCSTPRKTAAFLAIAICTSAIFRIFVGKFIGAQYSDEQRYVAEAFVGFSFVSQLQIFLLGILTFQILDAKLLQRDNSWLLLSYSIIVLFAALMVRTTADLFPQSLICGIGFVLFTLALSRGSIKFLVNNMIVFIGKISFSVYLVHFYVIRLLRSVPLLADLHGDAGFLVFLTAVLIVSGLISFVTYKIIEIPGMSVGNWIIRNLSLRNTQLRRDI